MVDPSGQQRWRPGGSEQVGVTREKTALTVNLTKPGERGGPRSQVVLAENVFQIVFKMKTSPGVCQLSDSES